MDAKPLTAHQKWRATVIDLRLMNDFDLYQSAYEIAVDVLRSEPDEIALKKIAKRIRRLAWKAAARESNRREAVATISAVCSEIAEYFVTERKHFDLEPVR